MKHSIGKPHTALAAIIILAAIALGFNPGNAYAQKSKERQVQVKIETTQGTIVVALYNQTPKHRDNFLNKVKSKYYDGILFHRVIKDFMIQAGDAASKTAKAGELLGDSEDKELIDPEFRIPQIFHKRGVIAMARESDQVNPERKSSSTQFYIVWGKKQTDESLQKIQQRIDRATNGSCRIDSAMSRTYKTLGGTPHLDGQYTVFGEVIKGMEVVDKIQQAKTDDNDRPEKDIRILKARIIKKNR